MFQEFADWLFVDSFRLFVMAAMLGVAVVFLFLGWVRSGRED